MEYFTLLTLATAMIGMLAIWVYQRSGDAGTLVGTGALYYWSLFGAWSVVVDKTGGFSGKHYYYLETKLFPISLDGNYLMALSLYAGFILVVQITMLATLPDRVKPRSLPRLRMRHEPILLLGFAAAIGSMAIMREGLTTAWALHTSVYQYTRREVSDLFTLHQVLNRAAMLPAAVGLATLLAGDRSRYFVSVRRRYTLPCYLLLLGGMGMFTFLLGNKNEVLVTLVAGILAYLSSVYRPNWWRAGMTVVAGLWFLFSIDYFRGYAITDLTRVAAGNWGAASDVATFLTSSNESFGAHFSMYGVLAANVAPRFGYSLYALVCSVVPRALWQDRPRDIYLYYSESVGAIQNQGYSLHHATGWYLNFGSIGVVLGAIVLGLVWAYCISARRRIRSGSTMAFRLFAVVSPWLVAAYIPPLVRAGPEGYKGLVIEGFLIPVGILIFCCRPKRRKRRAGLASEWAGFPVEPANVQLPEAL